MIKQATKLVAEKAENLNGDQFADAIRMINLIEPDDTIFSWMASCAEQDCDCGLWDDIFGSMVPDPWKLNEDEILHQDLFKQELKEHFGWSK